MTDSQVKYWQLAENKRHNARMEQLEAYGKTTERMDYQRKRFKDNADIVLGAANTNIKALGGAVDAVNTFFNMGNTLIGHAEKAARFGIDSIQAVTSAGAKFATLFV